MRNVLAAVVGLVVVLVAASARGQSLPCEKYTLPNGLVVILHVDHSLPVAGVNLWYRVGARNEPKGLSGFAHLFEHLMFMGTRRVPGSDFDNLMEAGGGSNNASTSLDRTNYFSSGPSSILPLLLWLDADRLEDLGVNMNKEKLDLQRDVVRNELRQVVENAPYGRAYEATYQLMYPPDHPYHHGVIGTHQDLEAATVDDVKNFFASFYAPDNCSLVVAGDFEPREIKPLIERLFSDIPRGNTAPQPKPPAPKLDRVVRRAMIDKVQLPKLAMAWHSPGAYQDGDAEMDLAALLLTGGKNSRLHKRLVVADQTAVEVTAFQDSGALGSIFRVEVLAKPDADLAAIEKVVDEELAILSSKGPTEAELAGRAAEVEMGLLSSLQSVMARADKLNQYQYAWGQPDSLQRDLNRYRKASPGGVRAWARRVLSPDARLIMRVLPEEPLRSESGPREQRPADAAAATFTPALPEVGKLSSGVPVYVWTRKDLPLVACRVLLGVGGPVDDPAQAGRGALLAKMLTEGGGDLDGAAFAAAIQALGGAIDTGADHESVEISMQVLARNFDRAAGLMSDAVLRPRLAEDDWARVKALHLDELRQQDEEPQAVAPRVAARRLFAEGSPLGMPPDGTPATIEGLALADIKAAHAALLDPRSAAILVAGDITLARATEVLEKELARWPGATGAPARRGGPSAFREPGAGALRVFIVDRPGAVQTVLHLAAPGVAFSDPQRVGLELANIILGGSFTSRLNRNLREVHGYTYGARSRVGAMRDLGVFRAATAVRAEVTGPALKEFLGELARIGSGDISPEEAGKARETYRNAAAQARATLAGLLAENGELLVAGVPLETAMADLDAAARADAPALASAATALIVPARGVLVLVGDRKTILEQIAPLQLPAPVVVDAQGNAVPVQ